MLPFAQTVGKKHLIVNVLWKILLNLSVIILFRALEKYIPMISEFRGLTEAGRQFAKEIVWPLALNTLIVHILFLIIYNNAVAMIHVLGSKNFIRIITGPTDSFSDE